MSERDTMKTLLAEAGRTYAAQAGIKLDDKPAPLYRLLVLSILLSTRIKADIAVDAARELASAGMGTPKGMTDASWQDRVDALGRAHYKRYDEQTATALGDGARLLLDEYGGDLRKLRAKADGSARKVRELLTAFPRLGPTGANIFAREAQAVWPELRPALDGKALDGARRVGLPTSAPKLAALTTDDHLAELAAALVRVALDRSVADKVTQPVSG
ncbi:endonuclease [Pseudonocardia acaciae]|uniref:endonuclease n=1 Tax=Pseudonocardia acaciae TaxID=551276 RepID=UPI0004903FE7|nr:endonuclease [Pseudonocardia acaciae]